MTIQAVTIDAEHSKDLDDAIWVEPLPERWVVTVAIANVAKGVSLGSRQDEHAFNQVATRYYATGNVPMLPRSLSEDALSLLPGQPRHVFTMRMVLDDDLNPVGIPTIGSEKFTSAHRLAFTDIPTILTDGSHELHSTVGHMARLAERLLVRRRSAGALAMYDLNQGWVTTEDGSIRQLADTRETVGYVVVQEFMILANAELARFCAHHEIPVIFRNHTAKAHAPDRGELMSQLAVALHQPVAEIETLRQRVHMSMNLADYGAKILGHYGLNLPAYMHATSPIRRFADLVNQRQVLAFAEGHQLPYRRDEIETIANHINAKVEADREHTTEQFKARVTSQANRALDKGTLAHLDDVQFERVTKVCVREHPEPPPAFDDVFRTRLQEDRAAILELFLVLVGSGNAPQWQGLRQAVVDHLARYPHKAASVASVGINLAKWSEVKYQSRREGADHAPVFRVKAKVHAGWGEPESEWVLAGSMKVGKQRALVDMLARIAGVTPPGWDTPQPKAAVKIFTAASTDPVACLQEWCQYHKASMPTYTYQREGGPDHAPLFTCICEVHGNHLTSKAGPSKKDVKKEAALMAFQQVSRPRVA